MHFQICDPPEIVFKTLCVLGFFWEKICPFPKILRKIPDPTEFKTIKIIFYSIYFIFNDFNQT